MAKYLRFIDDGGSIPPTRSNPWVVGSSPSLAAKVSSNVVTPQSYSDAHWVK